MVHDYKKLEKHQEKNMKNAKKSNKNISHLLTQLARDAKHFFEIFYR